MNLRRMLLPVSFNPRDRLTLAFACALTRQGVRELVVAHVVDSSGLEAPVIVKEVERARARLLEMVDGIGSTCGMDIEVRVVIGSVFRELTALAHEARVDVVCCGTEGKSFVDYLFSGSISEDLALKGDLRTMTVRYELLDSIERARSLAEGFARRLVVPTDFSASAMRAFLSAFSRPREAIGEVHLVHVKDEEADRVSVEEQLKGLASMARSEYGVEVLTAVREGDPPDALLSYVREVGASGLITGRTGRGALGKALVGSVSMRLIQEAPCPVVVQP